MTESTGVVVIRCGFQPSYFTVSSDEPGNVSREDFFWQVKFNFELYIHGKYYFQNCSVIDVNGSQTIGDSAKTAATHLATSKTMRGLMNGIKELDNVSHYTLEWDDSFPQPYRIHVVEALDVVLGSKFIER